MVTKLGNNQIGKEGANAIAAALPSSKAIEIHIDDNNIGDEGAKAIVAARPSSKVIEIELGNNQVGDERSKSKCCSTAKFEGDTY